MSAVAEPAEAQIAAGNYPKGHVAFQGLDLTIETPKGMERRGTGPDGEPWAVTMPADYGYIRRTTGADDEHLDCYLGPERESDRVWIVHQNDLGTGAFDEHKVMLGFADRATAVATYVAAFSDGKGEERIGKVVPTTIDGLKRDIAADDFRGDTTDLTDHQTAEAIRDGDLPSPTKYGDFWLFDLRITGTGAAYRDSIDEYAIRDPDVWLRQDFVDRCNGLTVTFGHPERAGLNHKEFQDRAIGSVVLPYRKGDEVRGVAKIFDADAAALMQATHRSTSPGVTPPKGSEAIVLKDGTKVLAEGLPLILDHLAVCEAGVWDKNGPPDGIRLDSRKDQAVADDLEAVKKERDDAKAEVEKLRADAARRDAESHPLKRDAEGGKSETEREAIREAEREENVDARRKRHDCARNDGESDEDYEKRKADARKDETEEEKAEREKREEKAQREDKSKKDGAAVKEVDPDRGMLLDAAKKVPELEAEIARLRSAHEAMSRQPTIEDRNQIATAYHRADSIFQALGESTPLSYPGESPLAYRRRLADGLRKFLPDASRWKTYTIHDALDAHAFDLVEKSIYDDVSEVAKNPPKAAGAALVLREVRQDENGKKVSRFYGDPNAAWIPFMPPSRTRVTKFNNNPAGVR